MTVKRRMPIKLETFQLSGDYEGWEFTARVNPPVGILDELQSGDSERVYSVLSWLIKKWNFVDEDGKPLGDPSPETIRQLPLDLLFMILDKITDKIGELTPKLGGTSSPRPG